MAEKSKSLAGTKIQAVAKEQPEIGIDTKDTLVSNIIEGAIASNVDISKLEGFSSVAQTREQVYRLIDTMSQDPTLASYLEIMSEDVAETNDKGQVVWCESADEKCGKYVSYLLDSLNVDKNIYAWVYTLIKYGDVYLRLYRQSDYEQDAVFGEKQQEQQQLNEAYQKIDDEFGRLTEEEIKELEGKKANALKESVNVVTHSKDDHYVHYVELVPNPGEMFELVKFGKTQGYIQAPTSIQNTLQDGSLSGYMQYKMRKGDVDIYGPTEFVHGALEDNSSRVPEEVNIFLTDDDFDKNQKANTYTVRRGQSEFSNIFKIWRELSLLENSVLLNRITKSSIIRTIQVEVGNMPKEQIGNHLQSIKQLMEQKSALNTGKSLSEYTNPGPVENNIYIPTKDGIGAITTGQIGGDVDPKQLTDLEYFRDKLFGALGVPKAYFNITDDGAGFNGGQSLSILSSRFGKSVKRVQNTICQTITDIINLMLLDKGLSSYVNKFTIRMQEPITQEELDRRENKKNKIGVISDIMNTLTEITNPVIKLKILKSLLADAVNDTEIVALLQEQVDELEQENKPEKSTEINETPVETERSVETPEASPEFSFGDSTETENPEVNQEPIEEPISEPVSGTEQIEEPTLPSPAQLDIDMTQNQ